MENQHTPGPWGLFLYNDTIQIGFGEGDPGANPCVVHWAGFDGNGIDGLSNHANAHLIAAAPELLEALEILHAHLFGPKPKQSRHEIDDMCRAAIAKVRGQQ